MISDEDDEGNFVIVFIKMLVRCALAETNSGSKHHRVGGFRSGGRADRSAVVGDCRPGAARPVLLAVPARDRGPRLHDGMGQRHADQRHVAGDASHLVELEGDRADDHRGDLVPRDEGRAVVGQCRDGGRRRADVRRRAHARGRRRQAQLNSDTRITQP